MIAVISYLLILLLILFFLIFMTFYTIFLIYSSVKGSPYVPTKQKVVDNILKHVSFNQKSFLIELGSGDGRFLRKAAIDYEVSGIGFDVNPLLVFWANLLVRLKKIKNIEFKTKNIFDADITKATVVYIFLMPELIEKLNPKFDKELKKGTVLISHGFPVKEGKKKLEFVLKAKPFSTYYYRY